MISADDVFQDSEDIVVDCDVLEAAKENVQPLGTGRRVTALSALLATPHAHRDAKLSATRNRLRINVELALDEEDGDPLEPYCRLVYWTLENYPQGHSAESGLLELLEEATRVLKDYNDGVYRDDLKYLKLWLLYASYVERPTIIYKFLLANDIGANFALLYEEHAAVLERDGRKHEADKVYALGVARKAEPLDRLESRYQDFQKRMISTMSAPSVDQEGVSQPPPTRIPAPSKRQALATTSKPRPATTYSRTAGSRTTMAAPPATIAPPPPPSRTGFQIFVDSSSEAGEVGKSEGAWNDLGTRKTRVKENVPEARKLAGTTLKQAGRTNRLAASGASGAGPSGSSTSRIVPFVDPVVATPARAPPAPTTNASSKATLGKGFMPFMDEKEASSESAKTAPPPPSLPPATPKFTPFRDESGAESSRATAMPAESVIKVKKSSIRATEPSSEAEALRKDPLKNYSSNDIGQM